MDVVQRGLRALELATKHRERIEERLPGGAVEGLSADLGAVGEVVPAALAARGARRAATGAQLESAETAARLVMAVRRAIESSGLGAAARKAFGIGVRVDPKTVKSVLAAGELILGRAASHPAEAREAGVLPRDLEALGRAVAAARGADTAQEEKKLSQKAATSARDATLVRIEATVKRVSAAGQLEFAAEPAIVAEFAALAPAPKAAKKTAEPAPAT